MVFWPWGTWDLSSQQGIEPASLALEAQSVNHWTTREVPGKLSSWYRRARTAQWSKWKAWEPDVVIIVVVQSLSPVRLCNPTDCSTPGFSVLHYLLKFAQIHVLWFDDAIEPSHLLPPSSPFAFNLSSIRVFSNELALHISWLKYWSFSINPFYEYSGLISYRITGYPCGPRDFQKSSPASQFKSINSLTFTPL